MVKSLFYFSLSLLFISLTASGQIVSSDTSFIHESYKNADNEYKHRILFQSFIYNGQEYVDYDLKINGDPYFEDEYYEKGTLTFDGRFFDSIDLKYDINKQLLILRYYDNRGYKKDIILQNEKIEAFDLFGHHFIHIRDTSDYKDLEPGLYDILYKQDFTILSKRKKIYVEEIEGRIIKKNFYIKDQFYVDKGNQIYTVKNKRSCLNVFNDRKKELQKYIKRGFLDFKNDFEGSLLSVANYYSSITQ